VEITEGLEGFVEIVGHGSLSAAATELGVPRSTLSRQLARLEERMGVRLLHRTTRRIVPTSAGEELYQRARRVVEDARAAVDAVRRHDDVPRGRLRVTAPPSYDEVLAEPILGYLNAWPEVELEFDATARIVDLVAEGFDVALRGGRAVSPPQLVSRPLLRTDAVAVASPAYLRRHGTPKHPDDLADHVTVLGFDATHQPEKAWPLVAGGSIPVRGRIVANDLVLRRAAASRGAGIALLPYTSIREAVREGALVHVLPDVVGASASLAVVYAGRALLQPKVRAFVDHLIAWAATLPPDPCTQRKRGIRK
jgi:DNA-binding transcriptional LysR family regulator